MIEVYIDGASAGNPGPSGAGIFIKENGIVENHSVPLGVMSNQEAEFAAFVLALQLCREKKNQLISFRTDSDLVATAYEKKFVKNPIFKPYLEEALYLTNDFRLFFMKWIPSSQNNVADSLARAAIRKNS